MQMRIKLIITHANAHKTHHNTAKRAALCVLKKRSTKLTITVKCSAKLIIIHNTITAAGSNMLHD